MKKIININLSGRVIPIEDSAYESLQRYIESLRRFFINEEGRDEIINDIESRMAELMNEKIRKGAGAITDADMEQIIASMGRVEDFEPEAEEQVAGTSATTEDTFTGTGPRFRGRLYRDPSDKILGGVCSGIANYLNIDPAIIRLLFALLIFGAGTGILIYILLWIILPTRPLYMETPQRTLGKRLFRNPDDKILGGVAGGLAAYFNKEAWMFRLIFAAPLLLNVFFGIINGLFFWHDIFPNFFIGSFTGTFIITYIIFWIILPEAKTPYDKMEMRGENVDVNTIKQNVQEGMSDFKTRMQGWGEEVKSSAQDLGNRAKEFAGTRGKEFATEVRTTTTSTASGLGRVLGILFKALFIFIAGIIAFSMFIIFIVMVFSGGLAFGAAKQSILNFFLDGFWQHAFFWGTIVFFFLVPVAAFITWLVRRIMKIRSRRHYLAYVFATLWFFGVISAAALAASITKDFVRGERLDQNISITQPANKMTVVIEEPAIRYTGDLWFVDEGDGWDLTSDTLKLTDVKLRVVKSSDSLYGVTVQRFSRGQSRSEASLKASRIQYTVESIDSALKLGSGFAVDKNTKYRGQRVIVEIAVPVGKMIRFDESVVDKLHPMNIRIKENKRRKSRRDYDYDWHYDNYFDWKPSIDYVMTETGILREASGAADFNQSDSIENLERSIEERNRQIEIDRQRLEDLKEQKNTPATSTTFVQKRKKEIPIAIPFIPVII